jgi:hypothetical protein
MTDSVGASRICHATYRPDLSLWRGKMAFGIRILMGRLVWFLW